MLEPGILPEGPLIKRSWRRVLRTTYWYLLLHSCVFQGLKIMRERAAERTGNPRFQISGNWENNIFQMFRMFSVETRGFDTIWKWRNLTSGGAYLKFSRNPKNFIDATWNVGTLDFAARRAPHQEKLKQSASHIFFSVFILYVIFQTHTK